MITTFGPSVVTFLPSVVKRAHISGIEYLVRPQAALILAAATHRCHCANSRGVRRLGFDLSATRMMERLGFWEIVVIALQEGAEVRTRKRARGS
jgi:hypothetical protein